MSRSPLPPCALTVVSTTLRPCAPLARPARSGPGPPASTLPLLSAYPCSRFLSVRLLWPSFHRDSPVAEYIVQGHRYDIVEDLGCFPETYETWVAVLLYHLPPTIIGSISAVYCICSIRSFYRSRTQFKALLSSNNNLSVNRYIRLMCLAATDLLCTVPISIWIIVTEASV